MTKVLSKSGILAAVFAAAFIALFAAGCRRHSEIPFSPLPFPVVSVPKIYMEDQEAAVEYAVMHYWDNLSDTSRSYPCDSSLVSGVKKQDVEQAFANYIALLQTAGTDKAKRAVSKMFDAAAAAEKKDTASNVFETLTFLAQRYLYDPNSPMRIEDLYGVYASRLSEYDGFTAAQRAAYSYDAEMCALNAIGTQAADFSFSDASGKVSTLYGIKADYTLLFFSNPGCTACKEIIRVLTEDISVGNLISEGKLAVVNVYIDEDVAAWYDYMPIYPDEWYNGYDPNGVIRTDTLYNVRAIPSLYLLDSRKEVIMKDAPEENVFRFLSNI